MGHSFFMTGSGFQKISRILPIKGRNEYSLINLRKGICAEGTIGQPSPALAGTQHGYLYDFVGAAKCLANAHTLPF